MVIKKADKEYIRFKLAQARDAYEEAQGLFADGGDLGYVLNSLYYAFLLSSARFAPFQGHSGCNAERIHRAF